MGNLKGGIIKGEFDLTRVRDEQWAGRYSTRTTLRINIKLNEIDIEDKGE